MYYHPSSYLRLEDSLIGPTGNQRMRRIFKTVWFRVYNVEGERSNLVFRNLTLSSAVRVFTDRATGVVSNSA